MPSPSSPIIVLDSGLGGLTVVRSLRHALPQDDILYFGDTARVPYGPKSANTVTSFVREILAFLQPYDPKHVVFACNTATALALPTIRNEFPALSISGVVDPGAHAAVCAVSDRTHPRIGIIGTEATVRSRAYLHAILALQPTAHVIARPTPLLVPIIEEGRSHDDPIVRLSLEQYLQPLLRENIDVLVLGCTHYPILQHLISDIVGPRVSVIDSAHQCAHDVLCRLHAAKLQRAPADAPGSLRCFVTDDSPRFASLASRFLGLHIVPPTLVSLDDLHLAAASIENRPPTPETRVPHLAPLRLPPNPTLPITHSIPLRSAV